MGIFGDVLAVGAPTQGYSLFWGDGEGADLRDKINLGSVFIFDWGSNLFSQTQTIYPPASYRTANGLFGTFDFVSHFILII
jgi:hypothetical protein